MKRFLTILAAFCCMSAIFAQTTPKIVTGHPDFKVKVTRCEASGKNVVLDLVFSNISAQDVEEWGIYTTRYCCPYPTVVYDSEGNKYDGDKLSIKVSNSQYSNNHQGLKMISDVPMKVSLMITGVPTNVESLARVDLDVKIPLFNIGETPVKIKNIPIAR